MCLSFHFIYFFSLVEIFVLVVVHMYEHYFFFFLIFFLFFLSSFRKSDCTLYMMYYHHIYHMCRVLLLYIIRPSQQLLCIYFKGVLLSWKRVVTNQCLCNTDVCAFLFFSFHLFLLLSRDLCAHSSTYV